MSNIRIDRIRLHNFKGVDDLDFPMTDYSAIILGGKNGFGKTTIFDAIELVLTGSIERYRVYEQDYFDFRRALSQEERPLVCDKAVLEVRIDLYLSIDLGDGQMARRILTRRARTADMKNPMDFSVFNNLLIREEESDEPAVASDDVLNALGVESFAKYYSTLNYMSQEESTRFIKSKDTKRRDDVQFIFNTEQFDRRINKIEKVLRVALKSKKDAANSVKQQKEQTIQALQQYATTEVGDETTYQRIFNPQASVSWDIEQPRLSSEVFTQVLGEGGVLDNLAEMLAHKDEYRKWHNSQILSSWLEHSSDYAFFLQYRSKEDSFALWKDYQQKTVLPYRQLELQNIEYYRFELNDRLLSYIDENKKSEIQIVLQQVCSNYKASTSAQQAYQELLAQRDRLSNHIRNHQHDLSLHRCPLCGQSYETMQQLLESLETTMGLQLTSFEEINNQVSKGFSRLKELVAAVIETLNSAFQSGGVSADIIARYDGLDKQSMTDNIKKLTDLGLLANMPLQTVEETETVFRKDVLSKIEAYDDTLDYTQMKRTFDAYVRFIPKEMRTVETIQQKRAYLLQQWNRIKSQQMEQLTREKGLLQQLIEKYDKLDTQMKQVRDAIIEQKNAYLKKVITDVEILFYVYSGRIMQDNFYGRGLFMKNEQGKYISFVTQYNSGVDALYKMSSGQLVALMMALLLSLNKLYSESKILAIDDPVQTIDDINVWGFVETLRHEFKDYQFLFSTHELSYGSFLRYKLSNMNIAAKYVDMMEVRKNQ